MGIRKYKPTTPGRRGSSVSDFAEITRSTPEKSLLASSTEQNRWSKQCWKNYYQAYRWRT